MKPEEYTIYERVPALSPGSFDERHMRRNLRITKLYDSSKAIAGAQNLATMTRHHVRHTLGARGR